MNNVRLVYENGVPNIQKKLWYADDNSEISLANFEAGDRIYSINDDELYQVEYDTSTEQEYSGAVVSFETDEDDRISSLEVEINPVQELHGQANPYPAGGGKNLLNMVLSNVNDGQRYTMIGDEGNYTITSTDEYGRVSFLVTGLTVGEQYTVSMNVAHTAASGVGCNCYLNDANVWAYSYGTISFETSITPATDYSKTFTATSDILFVGFYITAGARSGDIIVVKNAMVEKGSFATSYATYANICPISGHTGCNVVRMGKNLCNVESFPDDCYWGASHQNLIDIVNALPVGTYTLSQKAKVKTLPDNGVVQHGRPYITAMVNGSQVSVLGYSVTADNFPTVGKVYLDTGTFTITEENKGKINHVYLYCDSSVHSGTGRGLYSIYDIQIERSSTVTDYEPYQGSSLSINWQSEAGTVYGCSIELTTGVLTVEAVLEVFDTIDELNNLVSSIHLDYLGTSGSVSTIGDYTRVSFAVTPDTSVKNRYNLVSSSYDFKMCNMLKHSFAYNEESAHWYRNTVLYAFFPTALVGSTVQSVYDYLVSIKDTTPLSFWIPLATPVTYQLDPVTVNLLLGQNNIWADTGDTTIKLVTNNKILFTLNPHS